ncbi:jerky protein homolog-like, partial [Anoplophora glabripennis]|uniref:jerky protein homolog-like n=1 Tax=Anoplophora glabripennis TaxID=217634 RepID=UPI000C76F33C
MSADISGSTDFQIKFLEMVEREKLTPEQVYNMDETGINFKMLPEITFLSSHEKSAPGFKKNKERITVAVCSNAAGTHKIPLFVFSKSAKPRAFKNLNPSSLPVYYRSQKSAWMSTDLFKEWFNIEFVPKVIGHLKNINLPIKAVLILDNAPTQPQDLTCHTADIKIIYLPPNVTSLIQPMDQGVIESLKKRYRRKLVSEILQYSESEDKGLLEIIKKINIKDVIYMLAMAFQEMPSATFVKSWRKLWPDIEKLVANANPSGGEEVENESILQDLQKLSGNDTMQPED